ncbi:MAG: hypothetical protein AB1690_12410 [Candidatus Zixiibacteriota bacterium]
MSEPKKGMSRGCLIALVVFAVILVIVIAMSIVCYVKRDSIMEWGVLQISGQMQREITADPPEGITKEEVDSVFNQFNQAVKEKKVDPADMQSLTVMIQEIMKDKKVDHEEALRFMNAMKEASGQAIPAETPAEPEPQPVDSV